MSSFTYVAPELIAGTEDGVAPSPGVRLRLSASCCRSCERTVFPAMEACPVCTGTAEEVALACDARLMGFTSVLHPPPGAEVAPPYHIGVAGFPEQLSVMGLLELHDDREVSLGDPVETVAVRVGDELTYGFRPRT